MEPMDLSSLVRSIEAGVYSPEWKGDSWRDTLAHDVDLVWGNALAYNPADSVVAQSARELQEHFAPLWAKLVEEEGEEQPAAEGGEDARPKLLVMHHYAFVTAAGMVIPPDALLEHGVGSARLVGDLVRNRLFQAQESPRR